MHSGVLTPAGALGSLKRPTAVFMALGLNSGMGQTGPMSPQGSGLGVATVSREDYAGHGHLPTIVSDLAKALALLKNKGGFGLTIFFSY